MSGFTSCQRHNLRNRECQKHHEPEEKKEKANCPEKDSRRKQSHTKGRREGFNTLRGGESTAKKEVSRTHLSGVLEIQYRRGAPLPAT